MRVSSYRGIGRFCFRVRDNWRLIGLLFWVQRKRYRTVECVERVLLGLEEPALPGPEEGLENAVRSLVFRLRRPGAIERFRYSLDANGDPDWDREPWSSLRGGRRAPGAGLEAQPRTPRRLPSAGDEGGIFSGRACCVRANI